MITDNRSLITERDREREREKKKIREGERVRVREEPTCDGERGTFSIKRREEFYFP